MATTEQKIEEFAEDLGKMLGSAEAKAKGWLGQRSQIAKTLNGIRDTATKLLTELGEETRLVIGRRGRPAGSKNKAAKASSKPARRKMSAKARKAISRAQKARWAAKRAADKKK